MKKTLLCLGALLAIAIACQVNEPDTTPELEDETSSVAELDEIFLIPEVKATFPGGNQAWATFVEENLTIPEADPQGRVFASFVVDKAGALHDVKLIRGIGSGADEAVLELLKKSPDWQAATQRGRAVNSRMNIVIKFGEPNDQVAPPAPPTSIDYADINEVFTIVEEMASFPGGTEAWNQFIKNNLKEPQSDVKGRVFASFVVDKQGNLQDIKLVRGIGQGADEAVVELLEKSPRWIPGKQRGTEVNSRMNVAIVFN